MNKLFFVSLLLFMFLLSSCGREKDSSGKSLSNKEAKAVEYIKNNLRKGSTLTNYEVVKGHLPYQLWINLTPEENRIFNNRLEYRRSLKLSDSPKKEKYLESDLKRFRSIEESIKEKIEKAKEDPKAQREFILVLATLEHDDGLESMKYKKIIAFNPETMEIVLEEPIPISYVRWTTFVSNGDFMEYVTKDSFEEFNIDSVAQTVSDPIVKFMLEPIK